jgi:hypothetical protein
MLISYLAPVVFDILVCILLQEHLNNFVVAFLARKVHRSTPIVVSLVQICALSCQHNHSGGVSGAGRLTQVRKALLEPLLHRRENTCLGVNFVSVRKVFFNARNGLAFFVEIQVEQQIATDGALGLRVL